MYQALPSDPFGCFKWPFQGLSDLHLGDHKVTQGHLEEAGSSDDFAKICVFSFVTLETWGF